MPRKVQGYYLSGNSKLTIVIYNGIFHQGPVQNPNVKAGSDNDSEADWDRHDEGGIFSIVVPDEFSVPVFGVMLKKDGEVNTYRKYPSLTNRSPAHREDRERNWKQIRELIEKERPMALIVAAKNDRSRNLYRDLQSMLQIMSEDLPDYKCTLEMRDPLVSKVYALSKGAKDEFPNFPEEMREGINHSCEFTFISFCSH